MIYLANPTGGAVRHMTNGDLGYIDTPLQGNKRPTGIMWCADNGCFNDTRFDEQRWWRWLSGNAHAAEDCLFATAPDVVGDHDATVARSLPWLPQIRGLGFPAAFVAQDGATIDTIPWSEFDVLFIGGSTEFKLGAGVRDLVREAKQRGLWVHMGRVNSKRRLRYADMIGCDSADGTYLVFGPDINLPKLLRWVKEVNTQRDLFEGVS